jgi:hypothetical protein
MVCRGAEATRGCPSRGERKASPLIQFDGAELQAPFDWANNSSVALRFSGIYTRRLTTAAQVPLVDLPAIVPRSRAHR